MLAAVTTIATRVISHRTQEIYLAKIGVHGFHEVELAMRALPQHEVRKPLLPRGANDEVGIGQASRVEVSADQLGRKLFCQVVDTAAFGLVLGDDTAHGIGYLRTTAIANSQVHMKSRVVFTALLGRNQALEKGYRKSRIVTDVLDSPVTKTRKSFGKIPDNIEQLRELGGVPTLQVVGGEKIEGDHLNTDVIAPDQELWNLLSSGPMAMRGTLEKTFAGPSTVTIDNHANVMRQHVRGEPMAQSLLVQTIEGAGATGVGNHAPYVSRSELSALSDSTTILPS
jgi:hypothetical protein